MLPKEPTQRTIDFDFDAQLAEVAPHVYYEGAPAADEDPADYLPRNFTLKGERLG